MQDEDTIKPTATDSSSSGSAPDLSLGSNPSAQQQDSDGSSADSTIIEPSTTEETADSSPSDAPTVPADQPISLPGQSDDLESIKSSVLQELAPIVSELDQEPEEKYRTLMMLIQSSDNQTLIKDAFEAAHNIEDKKAKAEALLSIVNEINYFTGKGEEKSEA